MKATRIITTVFIALASLAAHAQEGAWNGELNIMGTKLPLVFNFSGDGCTMDSPSQGAKGIPAEKTIKDDGTIKVSVTMIGATFEGKMENDEIIGTYTQNGFHIPLTLKPGKLVVKRPQTPVAPFPYKEENISFTNAGYTFNGTLPIRYDDRGWNDKNIDFGQFTTADFLQDAASALPLLRKRFNKVGILGHSEGGTIAMMLAAEGKADFIVSLAGMAISGKETLVMQNRQAMSSLGLPKEIVDSYCTNISNILDEIANGKKTNEITIDGVPDNLKPILKRSLEQANLPYIRHFITIDAGKQLSKIKCPVLALNGTKDTQVDCAANTTILETGLSNCKHTIKKIDGVNHLFQHCSTGSIVEYQQIEETIAPEVLETITKWINEQQRTINEAQE